jgi:nitroimidazol reductase NimA-like FMN-containing flavoprotein (pyridoxamine 5'-phosphate oxidase superfamily)
MGVRLTEDEAWRELARAHTGIITTMRRDGMPVSLPTWFVAFDRHVYVRTPSTAKKVTHVQRDPRASFLVERGERWAELCAVMLYASVELLAPGPEAEAVLAALDEKYADFRTEPQEMPDATRAHYSVGFEILKLTPTDRLITWDNSRIRLG